MKYLKLFMLFALLVGSVTYLTGCFALTQTPALGVVYTDVKAPLAVTSNTMTKDKMLKGEASAASYLGLIATGDASINAAATSAGITKIHHVDYHTTNILGIVARITVTVYGE